MSLELVKYFGSCHCGTVKWEVEAPKVLQVGGCNCTICTKKNTKSFTVPKANFKLLSGQCQITTYTFNTGQAKHTFCSKCGVHSFYYPRSEPNGISIMPNCIDAPLPLQINQKEEFDGQNWEEYYKSKYGAREGVKSEPK